MKIKAISFAILSSMILTACGGGGSDSKSSINDNTSNNNSNNGSNTNTSSNQTWSSFYIDQVYSGSNSDALGYDGDQITIKDGKYYSKNTNTLDNVSSSGSSFIVTQDGVYEDGEIDSTYGTFIGNATVASNVWTLIPYSKIGSSGLKFTHSYKTIDISGKSFNEVINPYDAWSLKYDMADTHPIGNTVQRFYTANASTKFPNGSTCLQFDKIESSQDYIELQRDTENDTSVQKIWNSEANKSAADVEQKIYKDTVAYITYQYQDADTYAKYQDKFFSGNFYSKGIEATFEDMINELKDDISQLTGQDKVIADEYVKAAQSSCFLYNETASKTIHNAISNFK